MSKKFREKNPDITEVQITSPEMRIHSQRPGTTDEDGNLVYITEQAHKEQCDVNKIITKYDKHGVIQHVSNFEAQYGDVSGVEFKKAQDQVIYAQKLFDQLPSYLRKRFENSPQKLLSFMDNPDNREEAINLGMINKNWTPETDGLGEHVKKGENKNIVEEG